MNVKKLIPAALSLAMVLSLAACGDDSAKTPGTKAPETAPVSGTTAPEGDGSLQRVLDAGKLTLGAEGNWIPYVYNEDGTGELTGFEVEIAKEVASRLGVEAEFNISDSWDPVMAGLDAGRYDAVFCGVNPKPERVEKYSVTASYAENPFCLVVAGDNDEITSFEDLAGKLCANSPSSTAGQIAQSFGAETADADLTAAMEMISTGRAAGTVNNVAAVDAYMTERPEVNVKIAAIYEPAEDERYMIESAGMLRKEDVDLSNKISEIIQEMIDDGTCYDLTVKYFGQTVADSTSLYQK